MMFGYCHLFPDTLLMREPREVSISLPSYNFMLVSIELLDNQSLMGKAVNSKQAEWECTLVTLSPLRLFYLKC